jgi:hypothetical protein
MVGSCLWPPPEGIEESYEISGRVGRFPVRDVYIQQEWLTTRSDWVLSITAASVFGEMGERISHTICPTSFLFHIRYFRQYSLQAEQVQCSHNVGAAVGRSCPFYIPPFLSFISQVLGLVSELEYWSLFMIAPFVWKEFVLFINIKDL